jgi:hypothetical protein
LNLKFGFGFGVWGFYVLPWLTADRDCDCYPANLRLKFMAYDAMPYSLQCNLHLQSDLTAYSTRTRSSEPAVRRTRKLMLMHSHSRSQYQYNFFLLKVQLFRSSSSNTRY